MKVSVRRAITAAAPVLPRRGCEETAAPGPSGSRTPARDPCGGAHPQPTASGRKVSDMSLFSRDTQPLDAALAVSLSAGSLQKPARRRRLQTQHAILNAHRQVRVVIGRIDCQQFLRGDAAGLPGSERSQIRLVDQAIEMRTAPEP